MAIAPFSAQSIILNATNLLSGGADPSAGGGVAAALGSEYLRTGVGTSAPYFKTGAANNQWTKLVQSFAWNSILDFGAVGDNATDDTAAIQAAINATAAQGGGVVFVPYGIFHASQLTINAQDNVQLVGSGYASIIKWVFNAGGGAGSLLTIEGGSQHSKVRMLRFDGSGLTNPAAGRSNHLVLIGAGTVAIETVVQQCQFGGMVASSGDGVHIVGGSGALVSRVRVRDCYFDGCSRFSIGAEQDIEWLLIAENYLTNCETEIAIVATADRNTNGVILQGNQVKHTSASVRHCLRLEGGATTQITRMTVGENVLFGGFATIENVSNAAIGGNIQTSGAYASADPVLRVLGNSTNIAITGANLIDRASGSSAGEVISVEAAGGASPDQIKIGGNILVQEVAGAQMAKVIDASHVSISGNQMRATNPGASSIYAIDIQAVTTNVTLVQVGPGNEITAAAGTYQAAIHLLANGGNLVDLSLTANQGAQMAYGFAYEQGGGGGGFTGQILRVANNFDSTTGDLLNIGGAVFIDRIGFNAGALGANLFTGSGSPTGVLSASAASMYLNQAGGAGSSVFYKESSIGTQWVGLGGTLIVFGAGDMTASASELFMANGFIQTATATEIAVPSSRPGTARNLQVNVPTAGVGAATVTYTARKNGADTALSTTIANTSTGVASDTTHSFTIAVADLLSLGSVKSVGVVSGQQFPTACYEIT